MEMRQPREFSKVNLISMASLCFLYSLVIVPGWLNFEHPNENIISGLDPKSPLSFIANLLITLHLIFALTIVAAPPIKALEKIVQNRAAASRRASMIPQHELEPLNTDKNSAKKRNPSARRESNMFTQPDVIPG